MDAVFHIPSAGVFSPALYGPLLRGSGGVGLPWELREWLSVAESWAATEGCRSEILFLKLVYLKSRTIRLAMCRLAFQMLPRTRSRPGQSQGPGSSSRFPASGGRDSGTQAGFHCCPRESSRELVRLELEYVLTWDPVLQAELNLLR